MDPLRLKEIERVCQLALDGDEASRDRVLDEACAGDAALRAEVEALLAHGAASEGFLEAPVAEAALQVLASRKHEVAGPDWEGRQLSHYSVTKRIGSGGMGVVFRARDVRLGRDVAIKALPKAFAADPERVARLGREAHILASLSHPNIAAVHGLEEVDGARFLVLEFIEGDTLDERLARGALSLEETLAIGRQIASGVGAAHERGIVHRDLKPSNIKIAPDGTVKILDFGLAKATLSETPNGGAEVAPGADTTTQPGLVLGTPAYMSPEQARGTRVDRRTDVWAFGCILFECLTAQRAFSGETASDTITAVLTGEPDWSRLPRSTPAAVRRALERCLRKDVDERTHDIADAALDLVEPDGDVVGSAPTKRLGAATWAAIAALVLVPATLAGGFLLQYLRRPAPVVTQLLVDLEPGLVLAGTPVQGQPSRTALALASDGSFLIYCAFDRERKASGLYLRRRGSLRATLIAGTEGGVAPFLSPDDRQIGFWRDEKIWKVPVEGGVPLVVTTVTPEPTRSFGGYGAAWGADGAVVHPKGSIGGLQRAGGSSGKVDAVTTVDVREASHRLPSFLPGGRGLLFTAMTNFRDQEPDTAILEAGAGHERVLLPDATDARYVSPRYLAFMRRGDLMAVRFDLATLAAVTKPVQVVAGVMHAFLTGDTSTNTGAGQFAVSRSGDLVYAAGGLPRKPEQALVWVDRTGRITGTVMDATKPFVAPRFSPGGERIAYISDGRLFVYDLVRHTDTPLTDRDKAHVSLAWSPDGTRVAYGGAVKTGNLFSRPWDRSGDEQQMTAGGHSQGAASWNRNGRVMFIDMSGHSGNGNAIDFLETATGEVTPFRDTKDSEGHPELSPDGRCATYSSNETGRDEVWVEALAGEPFRRQVSTQGGGGSAWSPDGRWLYYYSRPRMWMVEMHGCAPGVTRDLGWPPQPLPLIDANPARWWDVAPDGRRFVMVKWLPEPQAARVTQLVWVQNWVTELERILPRRAK